jgi:serine protease inhibitor
LKSGYGIALLVWVTLCCIGAASRAEAPPASTPVDKVAAAANDFGFRLLHALLNASKDGNLVISPLSVSLALGVAYNGAGGGTRTAMARTLGGSAFRDDDMNTGNRDLLETLRKADPAVQLDIANALWLPAGSGFKPAFIKLSHDFYQAEAETLNFHGDPDGAARTINVFKGKWTAPFDKKKTNPRRFFLQGGGSVMTPMMTQAGGYAYFETDTFQAIQLTYGNGLFVMYVFLPRKRAGLSDADDLSTFLRPLDEKHWTEWNHKFVYFVKGTIILPKFEVKYRKRLNDALESLCMGAAFDPSEADFSQIPVTPAQLWIDAVEHKTYVKVDEEGTEAAAATGVDLLTLGSFRKPLPFQMIVDHPFFCAIAERGTGALLFAGVITDPTRQ